MRWLSVEIHDVCPPFAAELEPLLRLVGGLGYGRPSLLVVPRYQDAAGRSYPLPDAPALVRRLRRLADGGAEILQHGLTHRAPGPPPAGLRPWWMHHAVSRGEAEFAHLSHAEARARLAEGQQILARAGLRPVGFVAPVWQQSPGARAAVRAAGFGCTARFDAVVSFAPGAPDRRLPSPALTFCAPNGAVDHPKRLAMRAVAWRGRHAPLVRLALHPQDVHAPGRLDHIRRQLERLGRTRAQWQYRQGLKALSPRAA